MSCGQQLERLWRIVATGFCFTVFGLGGLGISVVAFPLLLLIPVRAVRIRLARNLIQQSFRLFVGLMVLVGVISVEIRGREKLQRKGLLILANHPSLIDVVLLISQIANPDCVVKGSLWYNPFTWGPVRVAGFISNSSGPELIAACAQSVRAGNNLVIFPEGTRTRPGMQVNAMQRGAANVVVRGQLTITPVRIQSSETMLAKGVPWYQVPPRRPHFCLTVEEDIPTSCWETIEGGPAIQARKLTEILEEFFAYENQHG